MNLRDLRLAAGVLQQEAAKKLDVTQSAISYWESGKTRPCRKYHKKLAKLYGCTLEDVQRALEDEA